MPKARTKRVDCEEKGAGCHGCCIGCAVGNGLSCRRLCRRRRGNRLHFRQDDRGGGATTGGRGTGRQVHVDRVRARGSDRALWDRDRLHHHGASWQISRRMAEYEAKMKAAQKEAEEVVAQAKVRAQRLKEENERQMSAEAERIKAGAAREIDQERRQAIEDVRRYASELGLRVAEKVLERSLTDADHQRLAEEALTAVAKDFEKS